MGLAFLKRIFRSTDDIVAEAVARTMAAQAAVRAVAAAPAPQASVVVTTQPIVINPGDQAKIEHARYRIDAIDRHIAQHGEAGWEISAAKMAEFELERAMHVLALKSAGIEVT